MDAGFWHQRWVSEQIGFHQEQINPYLQRFWPALALQPGNTVFVPLCGKSRDMLWLAEQGFGVLGVEVSPLAVEAFFAENEGVRIRVSVKSVDFPEANVATEKGVTRVSRPDEEPT